MRLPTSTLNITLASLLVLFAACGHETTSNNPPPRTNRTQNGGHTGASTNHPQSNVPGSGQGQIPSGQSGQPPQTSGSSPNGTSPNGPIATQPIAPPQNTDCYKGDAFVCKIERLITEKTNKYRASQGLQPLTHDAKFSFVARDWSLKQGRAGNISHNGFPSARQTVYRNEFGTSEGFYGENVAMSGMVGGSDQSDAAAEAVAKEFAVMWWNSSGHRANMLGNFERIGVGMYKTSRGAWYATQVFQ